MSFRSDRMLLIARVLPLILFVTVLTPARGEERFGLEKRIPWDAGRLSGSPEPPLPYAVEKTFSKHPWKSPIYIAQEPGTDRLWAVQASVDGKGSEIVRIPADPDSADSEVVLGLPRQLTYSVCFHPSYATNGLVYGVARIEYQPAP